MTVEDLIKQLQGMNPKAKLVITSDNFELYGAQVEMEMGASEHKNGSIIVKTFKDAFDGRKYDVETYSMTGGDIPVVFIG